MSSSNLSPEAPLKSPNSGPDLVPGSEASAGASAEPITRSRQRRFPHRPIDRWRFWLPLGLQLALVLAIPLRNSYTVLTGETLVLQTVPVDPYDLLRGYSQTLRYGISARETVAELPGGEFLKLEEGAMGDFGDRIPLYLVLEPPEPPEPNAAQDNPPAPKSWKPIRVSATPPALADTELFIKAHSQGSEIIYNLERYYMPESQRQDLNDTIAQLQQDDPQSLKVEVKVDRFGAAVPVALLIGGDRYQF
ncbi:MAG: GDYXXLXY domain-containing protein [Synechococcales cyanobacterium RM1_1_8]|nr:GDYXXLXY domain-containing protein [Synechococcales cyanobacterium RM1_1_8]